MRIRFLLAALLLPVMLFAQERAVKGLEYRE